MEKICTGCYEMKDYDCFNNDKSSVTGKTSKCKECRSLVRKKEKYSPELMAKKKAYQKAYREKNKKIIKAKNKEAYLNKKTKKDKIIIPKKLSLIERMKRDGLKYSDLSPDDKFAFALIRIDRLELDLFHEENDDGYSIVFKSGVREIIESYETEEKTNITERNSIAILDMIQTYYNNPLVEIDIRKQTEADYNKKLLLEVKPDIDRGDYGTRIDKESMKALITFKNKYKLRKKRTVLNIIAVNWQKVTFGS